MASKRVGSMLIPITESACVVQNGEEYNNFYHPNCMLNVNGQKYNKFHQRNCMGRQRGQRV